MAGIAGDVDAEYKRRVERFFEGAKSSWNAALEDYKKDYERKTKAFFQAAKLYSSTLRQLRKHLAPDFNVIELAGWRGLDEMWYSHILAWLLDPNGSHGQSAAFLKNFIDLVNGLGLNLPAAELDPVEVYTEYSTGSGRLDVFIRHPDGWAIVLENKTEAQDQKDQMDRYWRYVDERFKPERYALLYLTPDGHLPDEQSMDDIPEDKRNRLLKCISYCKDIHKWLEACEGVCECDRVRWFIRELKRHMERRFGTEQAHEEPEDNHEQNGGGR